eukprot:208762-Chlamydomonas_euryale.AAC.1
MSVRKEHIPLSGVYVRPAVHTSHQCVCSRLHLLGWCYLYARTYVAKRRSVRGGRRRHLLHHGARGVAAWCDAGGEAGAEAAALEVATHEAVQLLASCQDEPKEQRGGLPRSAHTSRYAAQKHCSMQRTSRRAAYEPAHYTACGKHC